MIGSQLTRFNKTRRFCTWDVETEGLNLYASRPWELSYLIATLKDGILKQQTHFIWYPDLRVGEEAARVTRFNYADYKARAKPAAEVWEDFSSVLYDPEVYSVGHNLIGFDVYALTTLRRSLGLPPDHSWLYRLYDTNCLSKAFLKGWVPDLSSPSSFLRFQYQCLEYREKGLKTRLGIMAGHLGVPYDEGRAHGAQYDCEVNWGVFKGLVNSMDI